MNERMTAAPGGRHKVHCPWTDIVSSQVKMGGTQASEHSRKTTYYIKNAPEHTLSPHAKWLNQMQGPAGIDALT